VTEPPKSVLVQVALLARNVRRAVALAAGLERSLTVQHIAVAIVSALLPVAIAYVGKLIVDGVVAAIDAPGTPLFPTLAYVGIELGLFLAAHLAGQYAGFTAQLLRARLALHVDAIIFDKALRLSVQHFEDPAFMDMLERARKESSWRPLEMITHGLRLARNVVTLLGFAGLLLTFSGWAVLALLLAGLPFLAETRYAAEQYRIHAARTQDERQAHYLGQLLTSDYYVKEVKLFALGPFLLGRHRVLHERFYAEDRAFAARRALAVSVLGLLSAAVFYAIYAVIVREAIVSAITLGSMTLYLVVFRQGQKAFEESMSAIARAYEDNLYIQNLFTYLAIEDDDVAERGPTELAGELGRAGDDAPAPPIVFDHVTFRYPGSTRPCLDDVSFQVAPGETVALVGPNGAGKTTLVKLLVGLYGVDEGAIRIGDDDVSELDKGELRAKVGVVFQDFVHYHFTAADNVGIGWLPLRENRDAVVRAAEAGGAREIIDSLPSGFDSMLGRWFGGEQLSIGQWQRMALARAFMRRSRVLILDEPTASIDAEGEHEIFERFERLKRGATALLITHRFSTVRMADRIVVLDEGRIVEEGTHAELCARDGLYKRMFDMQAEGYR
jgi:ABC-type multidrug transport system fused ATPase/permease subunit